MIKNEKKLNYSVKTTSVMFTECAYDGKIYFTGTGIEPGTSCGTHAVTLPIKLQDRFSARTSDDFYLSADSFKYPCPIEKSPIESLSIANQIFTISLKH